MDTDTPADVIKDSCGVRVGTMIARTVGKLITKQRWLLVAAMSFLTAKSYVWHATKGPVLTVTINPQGGRWLARLLFR